MCCPCQHACGGTICTEATTTKKYLQVGLPPCRQSPDSYWPADQPASTSGRQQSSSLDFLPHNLYGRVSNSATTSGFYIRLAASCCAAIKLNPDVPVETLVGIFACTAKFASICLHIPMQHSVISCFVFCISAALIANAGADGPATTSGIAALRTNTATDGLVASTVSLICVCLLGQALPCSTLATMHARIDTCSILHAWPQL